MPKHQFERKDRFYLKAKKEGYPARSAYKIMEFDDQFKIFKPGNVVIDLGCAPGGWLKVGEERMQGRGILIGIDLLPLKFTPKKETIFIQGDFTDPKNQEFLQKKITSPLAGEVDTSVQRVTGEGGKQFADWVISDLSPNLSGVAFRDQFASVELCMIALKFALGVLRPGGNFLCKVFPGAEITELRNEIKKHFKNLRTIIPDATRKSSTEVYLLGLECRPSSVVRIP